MSEFKENLWAPWRMEYIQSLDAADAPACFLCDYRDKPAEDRRHHVVHRDEQILVVLNRFPYTNGHLLIAPRAHVADPGKLSEAESAAIWHWTGRAMSLLREAVSAQGFNVGMNFGLCAGAGLPDHLHIHVVPRWSGDTNFMSVLGDVRVIPQSLDRLHEMLVDLVAHRGLGSR